MPAKSLLSCFRRPPEPAASQWLGAVDLAYALEVARTVAQFGTYERGFRPAGSEAAHRCARWLEAEMRSIGLQQVTVREFALDGWEFSGARVEPVGGPAEEAVAYGGASGTASEGLAGELVDCGTGTRAEYARLNVRGKIALVEMDLDLIDWPGTALLEAAHHGAAAVICWPGSHYARTPGALHCHDLQVCLPMPMLNVSREAGHRLRSYSQARLFSSARPLPGAVGRNLVGLLPGVQRPEEIVIIGDHYDAWFTGFMDDATGVGAVMALARAAITSGYRPQRTLAFVLHDAEEYGQADSPWDWCTGAHAQITQLTPEWVGKAVGAVIFELCGFREAPSFDWFVSPELATLAQDVLDQLDSDDCYPLGKRLYRLANTWEDGFSYTVAGIPSAANLEISEYVGAHYYHTQFDTEALLDPDKYALHVAALGLLVARLDQEATLPLDFAARARDLRKALPENGPGRLFDLLEQLERAGEHITLHRASLDPAVNATLLEAAGILNRGLTWIGGEGTDETMYPHEQPLRDLAALKEGNRGAIAGMGWGQHVSYSVYRRQLFRQVDEPGRDWKWATGRVCAYVDSWHAFYDRRPVQRKEIQAVRASLEKAYDHEIAVVGEAVAVLKRI